MTIQQKQVAKHRTWRKKSLTAVFSKSVFFEFEMFHSLYYKSDFKLDCINKVYIQLPIFLPVEIFNFWKVTEIQEAEKKRCEIFYFFLFFLPGRNWKLLTDKILDIYIKFLWYFFQIEWLINKSCETNWNSCYVFLFNCRNKKLSADINEIHVRYWGNIYQ